MTEALLPPEPRQRAFALDRASREAGRRGLKKARAVLAQARAEHIPAPAAIASTSTAPRTPPHSVAA